MRHRERIAAGARAPAARREPDGIYTKVLTIRSSVFRKLLLGAALLIAVALASADLLLTRSVADRERDRTGQQMAQSLRILAPELSAHPPADLQAWANRIDSALHERVTVIDATGVVIAESRHDATTMENHRERPEVRAALAGHQGENIRRSATLDVDFYYSAVPVDSPAGVRTVLRLATPLTQVNEAIAAVRLAILKASGVAAVIAFLLAYYIASSFSRRIRRIERYAGELVAGNYSGALAVESDDELGSVARSLRDMAEHFRSLLDKLAQESARRDAILGCMVEGVVSVDSHQRITFCNSAFARAVNADSRANEGAPLIQVARDPVLNEILSKVVATGEPARGRLSLIEAKGRVFDVQAAPLRGADGGALATLHDVTELERLERVRRDFVTNISHELRTPLAAIQGYVETLRDGALEDPENNRKFLEIIASHANRLGNLAFDLLTLSEIETERPSSPERLSAAALAESALEMVEAQAARLGVHAYLEAADDVYVTGHKGRLERALANLLQNAINYNRPGGEVRVAVRCVDGTVRISVADNGIGIASQDVHRIFERFYRIDKARSRETGGTGLGLAIVKHTVERAGGSIAVESQLGKGSVFTIVLPAVERPGAF